MFLYLDRSQILCVATDRAVNETLASFFPPLCCPWKSCVALSLTDMCWFRVVMAGTLSQLPIFGMQTQPVPHHSG